MKWLSVAAVLWAMDDAPDVPPELVSTLLAVARYASDDGTGAYPSASTVAGITRKTERQAKRDLARLEKRGLLQPGDSRIVKDIRADRRPKVRDLPMPRGDTYVTPSSRHGVTPRVERGDIQGPNGVSPMSPEEFLKNSGKTRASRARAGGAHARAKNQGPPPTRCVPCRSGDHDHCLSYDPDTGKEKTSACNSCWCGDDACPQCLRGDHGRCAHRTFCYCKVCDKSMSCACDGFEHSKCAGLTDDGVTWCMCYCHGEQPVSHGRTGGPPS